MQKSQWLYLAQGNGILQLEGKTEEKEKTIQKLISGSNEEKKTAKQEKNSNQKTIIDKQNPRNWKKINGKLAYLWVFDIHSLIILAEDPMTGTEILYTTNGE